ncbi:hypothetical protein [Phytomonospora endophytica]|uniref:Uncharacterized protein n=1 Tax=Phytomonospora endophytica TaxID=714109 RepID=A0A841G4R4_9ACTN|nr:hypothetical protein [Phytomonospora endophytica]MBB6039100.1 hypothetical protein [Phytomonospora endophytica]GIG65571.1 hypothetical protein Pen01_18660 [Phytomonospora endophytica]
MDLHPIGAMSALEAARRHANSAMPNAPVVLPRVKRRPENPGPLRRGTAGTLRRLADRLDARRPVTRTS